MGGGGIRLYNYCVIMSHDLAKYPEEMKWSVSRHMMKFGQEGFGERVHMTC